MSGLLYIVLLGGCRSGESGAPEPYQELREQGMDRYLDAFKPADHSATEEGWEAYRFEAGSEGPICLYGEDYHTMLRDRGSEDLIVFLQGGGLCSDEVCFAVSSGGPEVPDIDILSSDAELNPVAGWSQVYLPYCDGSLFAGDVDRDLDGDGQTDRYQRGLANLSAALDLAKSRFPSPRRVLLAGSSGGGYGTLAATVLTRWTWPDTELMVFNDSGVGLGRVEDPEFVLRIIREFEAEFMLPPSLPELQEGGHLTPFIGWQLAEDPGLRMSALSFNTDYVISQIYLQVSYEDFDDELIGELGDLHEAWPDRYQYFIPWGSQHTALLGDPRGFLSGDDEYLELVSSLMGSMAETEIDGLTVSRWLEEFVEGGTGWVSVRE